MDGPLEKKKISLINCRIFLRENKKVISRIFSHFFFCRTYWQSRKTWSWFPDTVIANLCHWLSANVTSKVSTAWIDVWVRYMTRSWFVRPEDWISKILKNRKILIWRKNTHKIWILIWQIKKHFYTYLWEPIVKDNKVPELPFHCLTEAIKANSDFDNMFHNFWSAFNWILSLRWGLSCGKEDVKKAAGAEECGPGRRTIPWRKKSLWFDGKITQS